MLLQEAHVPSVAVGQGLSPTGVALLAELEDISEISGCCAVGPPCSSPNLLAVEVRLH